MWQGAPAGYRRAAFTPAPTLSSRPHARWEQRPGQRHSDYPSQRTRGGRGGRGGFPREFGPLVNLPIPPGALSDPWEALNAQHGLPEPLEAPTEEVLAELRLEVSRQLRLQQMQGQRETPTQKGPPAEEGRSTADTKTKEAQSECEVEASSGNDDTSSLACSERAPHVCEEPPARRNRPIVLPPSILDGGPHEDESMGIRDNSSDTAASSRGSRTIRSSAPTAAGRRFQLPAITGVAPESPQDAVALTLDEESIKKRLRLNSGEPR